MQVRQLLMEVQDTEEKMRLILTHLFLSSITGCYMGEKQKEVGSVTLLP